MSRSRLRFVALALLALHFTGCIAYRGGALGETTPWPPGALAQRKSVSVTVTGKTSDIYGQAIDTPAVTLKAWRDHVDTEFTQSGLFSAVLPEGSPADLRAEVQVTERGSANQVLAFISGFTFTVIPATAYSEITMRTDFKNADGDLLATVEKSDSVRMWIQLLLIFPMPFMWPGTQIDRLFQDVNRATLAEARQKGVL